MELLCEAEELELYTRPPVSRDAEAEGFIVSVPTHSDPRDVCESVHILKRDPNLASWVYVSMAYLYENIFGNEALAEGWLDVCTLTPTACHNGELANPAISAHINSQEVDEEIDEWRRRAVLSAPEQVQAALCRPRPETGIYRAPPLVFDYRSIELREDEIVLRRLAKPVGQLAVVDENFCGDVTILGRVPEALVPDGKTQVVLPWLLVRLGAPMNIEGWVNIDDACGGETLDICYLWSGMRADNWNAHRLADELRKVPVVESEASAGPPDLVFSFDVPQAGEACRGLYIILRNDGASATPTNIQIAYGSEIHELNLLRGLEPGEEIILNAGDYEQDVQIDPADQIPEEDEANNLKRSPEDPGLICVP